MSTETPRLTPFDAVKSLDSIEGVKSFINDIAESDSKAVLLQGLQTAALALRPHCDPDDFRLIVPAEALAAIQSIPPLDIAEYPPELHAVAASTPDAMFSVLVQLRNTTQQEILKALGFYLPCNCGVETRHEPFAEGVCALNDQLELTIAAAGNAPDMVVELCPEDDDEVAR
jgi:hypothetical protein